MAVSMPADQLERVAYDLRPFWLNDLAGASGADGAGSTSDPNALYTDGSRIMSGNLNMGGNSIINVNLVDGVDVPAFLALYNAHLLSDSHPMYALDTTQMIAGAGLTGGGTLAADRTFAIGTPTNSSVTSSNFASGTTHGHAIISSSNPGTTASILATDALGSLTIGGILTLAGGGRLNDGQQFSSPVFASGFAGTGFRVGPDFLYPAQKTAEFDNLIVRGMMRVYELVINKIRVSRGSLLISPGGMKVVSVTPLGGTIYQIAGDDDHGFTVGDLLRAQKFTTTTGVSGVWQSLCTVVGIVSASVANIDHNSGDPPQPTFEYAVSGHISNAARQGLVYLTADDSGAPFMDIVDGLSSHALWGSSGIVRTRVGKLSGVTDPFFGALQGYGIYANRGYFNGVRVNGSVVIGPGIGFSTSALLYCPFSSAPLDGRPNTNGHLGQAATATAVSAISGKFGGGVCVAAGATNRITNPSFETGSTSGYFTDGSGALTITTLARKFGVQALSWWPGTGANNVFNLVSGTLVASSWITFSVYVKRADGGALSGLQCYIDSTLALVSATIVPDVDGWYRVVASRLMPGAIGNHVVGIANLPTAVCYFDGWQVEQSSEVTPYLDGSLGPGFTWSGAAHASISTRSAGNLSYSAERSYDPFQGTMSCWAFFDAFADGVDHLLFTLGTGTNNRMFVDRVNASTIYFAWATSVSTLVATATAPPPGWHHVAMTWRYPGSAKLYVDGALVAIITTLPDVVTSATLQVGAHYDGALRWNSAISDFAIVGLEKNADDIQAIYASNARLNVTRSNYELVLTDYSSGRVVANAGGIIGTNVGGSIVFALLTSPITLNGEALGNGDVLIGNNSGSFPNIIYDASVGEFYFRSGVSNRVTINANGIEAGNAGLNRVQLSSLGITLYSNDTTLDPFSLGAIKFRNLAGTSIANIIPFTNGGIAVLEILSSGRARLAGTSAYVDAGVNSGDLDLGANVGKVINLKSNTESAFPIHTSSSLVADTNVRAGTGLTATPIGSMNAGTGYYVNGYRVVNSSRPGWALATGPASRATFDTSTVGLSDLAARVRALIDDLHTHHGILSA